MKPKAPVISSVEDNFSDLDVMNGKSFGEMIMKADTLFPAVLAVLPFPVFELSLSYQASDVCFIFTVQTQERY